MLGGSFGCPLLASVSVLPLSSGGFWQCPQSTWCRRTQRSQRGLGGVWGGHCWEEQPPEALSGVVDVGSGVGKSEHAACGTQQWVFPSRLLQTPEMSLPRAGAQWVPGSSLAMGRMQEHHLGGLQMLKKWVQPLPSRSAHQGCPLGAAHPGSKVTASPWGHGWEERRGWRSTEEQPLRTRGAGFEPGGGSRCVVGPRLLGAALLWPSPSQG